MGQALSLPFKLASTTLTFYRGFFYYLCGKGRYVKYLPPSHGDSESGIPAYLRPPRPLLTNTVSEVELKKFPSSSSSVLPSLRTTSIRSSSLFYQHARVHLFTLASEFYLYNKPHYRKGTYGRDMVDNFANVAIPGTGISLRHLVSNRATAFVSVTCIYPAVSLIAAVHLWATTYGSSSISDEYATRLLTPDDWFNYWRLNSRIVAFHSYVNDPVPKGYGMENKWTFLREGDRLNVPVSPYLTHPAIVVKHRNEEGGLGIHFYDNATDGGDWIIQERISNGKWVREHLPHDAPLSTFRVITQSRGALLNMNNVTTEEECCCKLEDITALSCVFRAGRAGAKTDHVSILFDVDVNAGVVLGGTTNEHWYNLNLPSCLNPFTRTMWRSKDHALTHHPDGNIPITGEVVPNIREMLHLVEMSHLKLCPDVPLVGWDVVLSADPKLPVCLLEVNLSCNFFRGSFDKRVYLDFLEDMIVNMQDMRLKAEGRI